MPDTENLVAQADAIQELLTALDERIRALLKATRGENAIYREAYQLRLAYKDIGQPSLMRRLRMDIETNESPLP